MPYRAMIMTVITVTLALLVVGLWVRAIAPVLAQARASTQPAATVPHAPVSTVPATQRTAAQSVSSIIRGTMLLSFLLICLMLIVGIFASMREWLRYRALRPMSSTVKKTPYVDAWKIAGERAKAAPLPPEEDSEPPTQTPEK